MLFSPAQVLRSIDKYIQSFSIFVKFGEEKFEKLPEMKIKGDISSRRVVGSSSRVIYEFGNTP